MVHRPIAKSLWVAETSAATSFFTKFTRFTFFALKLTVLLEIIYLCTLSPKNNHIIYKFVKIDHAEERKVLERKPSGFFQELKATTLTKYFRSINAIFNQYISVALIPQRNEDNVTGDIAARSSTKVKTIRNRDQKYLFVLLVQIFFEADIVRIKVTSTLKRHNSTECNLRPWELKAIKELRSLSDILFMKADKGNMTVIMNKKDYSEKLFEMLNNDETYEDLKRDPTAKTEKLLNKFISRLLEKQKITQVECFNLKSSDAHCTKVIYRQPKVHKPDIPLRPIVSFIGSPTYALSKKMSIF